MDRNKAAGITWRILKKLGRISLKIFIWIFILQFIYIIILKWISPPITITQFVSWVSGDGLKRDYVSQNNISYEAFLAMIASEDLSFAEHNGFDWESIKKAMKHNEKNTGRTRGASTISQQVAKNVFLWQGGGWFRKGLETYFTFMIEKIWGKRRILTMYLNVIEMGEGIFGIEVAAQNYFHKPAKTLSRQEAAMIAASLPNPKQYTVSPVSVYVANKSGWVMQQMSRLQYDPDVQGVIGMQPASLK